MRCLQDDKGCARFVHNCDEQCSDACDREYDYEPVPLTLSTSKIVMEDMVEDVIGIVTPPALAEPPAEGPLSKMAAAQVTMQSMRDVQLARPAMAYQPDELDGRKHEGSLLDADHKFCDSPDCWCQFDPYDKSDAEKLKAAAIATPAPRLTEDEVRERECLAEAQRLLDSAKLEPAHSPVEDALIDVLDLVLALLAPRTAKPEWRTDGNEEPTPPNE
jgi:hypothetical protein